MCWPRPDRGVERASKPLRAREDRIDSGGIEETEPLRQREIGLELLEGAARRLQRAHDGAVALPRLAFDEARRDRDGGGADLIGNRIVHRTAKSAGHAAGAARDIHRFLPHLQFL